MHRAHGPDGPTTSGVTTGRRAAVIALAAVTITGFMPVAGAAAASSPISRKISVDVGETCVAPSPTSTNACTLRGNLPGLGVDGTDLVWEVSLFANDRWRIQFQAFSEGPAGECQYPVRVWGSWQVPDSDPVHLVLNSGVAIGPTPADEPTVSLTVDRLRVDTGGVLCG